jgi:hypothetical protein
MSAKRLMFCIGPLAALLIGVVAVWGAGPEVKKGPAPVRPVPPARPAPLGPIKVLQPGQQVTGTLVKIDARQKSLTVRTANGLVKVPVNKRLLVKQGKNGPLVHENLANPRLLKLAVGGVKIVRGPDGTILILEEDDRVIFKPDGTIIIIFADGKVITIPPK